MGHGKDTQLLHESDSAFPHWQILEIFAPRCFGVAGKHYDASAEKEESAVMATKRRPPVDLWLVEDMLAANDGWCGCCGRRKLTIDNCQRGHRVKRKPDGSNDTPDNLFPICEGCNRAHTKSEVTPANALRSDFLARLALRVFVRIPTQYHCNLIPNQRNLVLTTQPTENSYVIDFKNRDFDAATEVCYLTALHGRKLSPDQAERMLDDLITRAEKAGAPPPTDKQRLISAVVDHGAPALARVGNRVMRLESWVLEDNRIDAFFWQRMLANFGRFNALERDYEKQQEIQRRREAEASRLADAQRRKEEQERADFVRAVRWERYLLAAKCTPWPGMTDDDRAFIVKVQAEQESPARDVSDDELRCTELAVCAEFRRKRQQTFDYLDLCDRLIAIVKNGESTEFFRGVLHRATTVSAVHDIHAHVARMHADLMAELRAGKPFVKQQSDEPLEMPDFEF